MKINKFVKQATALTFTTALLVGGGTQAFAKEAESRDHNESYGISHITRSDMLKLPQQHDNARFEVPKFDADSIRNIPTAQGYDKNGNFTELDVWDSWPLQNADGTVAEYNGYHLLFTLAGNPKDPNEAFIYLFYKKAGENSLDSWKNAGRVFDDADKFKPNDPHLKYQTQEWSGSATLTSDGELRLFYTDFSGAPQDGGTGYGKQTLTTAQVNVSEPNAGTIQVDGVEDHKSIYDGGDGKIYQNVQGFIDAGAYNSGDNHTLRDPHYIEDKGRKYLVFEANTGTEYGYQGEDSLFNRAYYGMKKDAFQAEKSKLLQSDKKHLAEMANGALGIIEINDDYTLKKEMEPLITSNTITDEIERANIFKKDGKWYLFTSARGSKMTIDGIDDKDIYMFGYSSGSLTGKYKPLNDTGIVLHHRLDKNDVTFNYAHFVIPQKNSDKFVVTNYMVNKGQFEDRHTTFGPSFLLNIKGSNTSIEKDSILEQGQITVDSQDKK
ncbi:MULTISPECIES: glycoside hydrolase family 68 protein [Bacillus]|uniref:Levansucrase n=2 Tax=Bacillus TaxID=1386 RepID=A0A0M3RAN0_9BACI|nr:MULTISPECIES: glycoside hydrolase family 68 protein [Bacillus]ALC83466.1 levansucrase [Bacillus gobiensis]MBP1082420.1 levansucrase [Bacillus capparidis]MED1097328.1 glycoside hydrolase family 68 protein [Bacillus capparidis]